MGETPQRLAKEASLLNLWGLSPATITAASRRGRYLHPELYGAVSDAPEAKPIGYLQGLFGRPEDLSDVEKPGHTVPRTRCSGDWEWKTSATERRDEAALIYLEGRDLSCWGLARRRLARAAPTLARDARAPQAP